MTISDLPTFTYFGWELCMLTAEEKNEQKKPHSLPLSLIKQIMPEAIDIWIQNYENLHRALALQWSESLHGFTRDIKQVICSINNVLLCFLLLSTLINYCCIIRFIFMLFLFIFQVNNRQQFDQLFGGWGILSSQKTGKCGSWWKTLNIYVWNALTDLIEDSIQGA